MPQSHPLTFTCVPWHTHTHTYTNKYKNKDTKVLLSYMPGIWSPYFDHLLLREGHFFKTTK